jgi:hypothetical protein
MFGARDGVLREDALPLPLCRFRHVSAAYREGKRAYVRKRTYRSIAGGTTGIESPEQETGRPDDGGADVLSVTYPRRSTSSRPGRKRSYRLAYAAQSVRRVATTPARASSSRAICSSVGRAFSASLRISTEDAALNASTAAAYA